MIRSRIVRKIKPIDLDPKKVEEQAISRTSWYRSDGYIESFCRSFVMSKAVDDFVDNSIAGHGDDSVILEREIFRYFIRMLRMCGIFAWTSIRCPGSTETGSNM